MNPMAQIKLGIETSSWDLIAQAYKTLTGESVDCPKNKLGDSVLMDLESSLIEVINKYRFSNQVNSVPDPVDVLVDEKPFRLKDSKKKSTKSKPVQIVDEDVKISTAGIPGVRKQPFKSGPVNAKGNIPHMPTYNEINPEEVELNKSKLRKDKFIRPEYVPDIKSCTGCSKKFDFNKAYPAGRWGDTQECLCSTCQTKSMSVAKN